MMKDIKKDDQGNIVSYKVNAQKISMDYVQALLRYLFNNQHCVKEIRIRHIPPKEGDKNSWQQVAVRIENELGQSWLSVGIIERMIHPTDKIQWRISGGYTHLVATKNFISGGKKYAADQIISQYYDSKQLSEAQRELLRTGMVYEKPCFHGFELTVTRTTKYDPATIPNQFPTISERKPLKKERGQVRGKPVTVNKKTA